MTDGPAARTIEETLDGWTTTWLEGQRSACADARIHGRHSEAILDLRTACLDRLRGDFAAIVDVLVAERRALDTSSALLEGLPSIQRCANLEMLRQAPRPPADATAAAAVAAELGRGHALRRSDRGEEARAAAERALAAATTLADGPLIADARFLRALILGDEGDFAASVADLEEAATLAEAQRHDLRVAEARVELARIVGQRGASVDERRRWFPLARAAVERLGDRRDPLQGMLAWAEAAALEVDERWDQALTAYDRASALGARTWPDDDRLLRLALRRAIVAGRLGMHEEAARGFESAMASILRRWGPWHRWYANALFDRGQFEIEHVGDITGGARRIEEALTIYRRLPGADVESAWAEVALAQAAYLRADYAEAEVRAREGLDRLERSLGPDHPDTLIVVDNLGAVLFQRGDLAGARAAFTRALAAQTRILGPEHPEVARLESHLGEVLLAEGDPRAARARLERALRILESQRRPDHLDLLVPLKGLGLALLALGDLGAARRMLERARAVIDANPGADPIERGEALWGLARALAELGERVDATAIASAAGRAFAEVHDPREAAVATWVADLLPRPARPDEPLPSAHAP